MARRREQRETPLRPAPSRLGAAASDPRTLWVFEVHSPAGRRVYLESLAKIEAIMPAHDGAPDTVMWLYPADTAWLRHKFGQLAKRGWMRAGWYHPDPEPMPAAVNAVDGNHAYRVAADLVSGRFDEPGAFEAEEL